MSIFKVNGKRKIWLLILCILITEGIGFLAALITMTSRDSYNIISKPVFSPPDFVFPIVWIVLYLLMAVSFYRIILSGIEKKNTNKAVIFFLIQLLLNFLWPVIFFKFNQYGISFIELIVLFIFIMLTFFEFFKHDKLAALLLIPYIIWVCFAGVLNLSIYMLNMIE